MVSQREGELQPVPERKIRIFEGSAMRICEASCRSVWAPNSRIGRKQGRTARQVRRPACAISRNTHSVKCR